VLKSVPALIKPIPTLAGGNPKLTIENNIESEGDSTMIDSIDFAGLTAAAKHLNQLSDSFHATLTKIQYEIISLGVGLEVWLTDRETVIPDSKQLYANVVTGWTLGLTKCDGAWCIALRPAQVDDFGKGDVELSENREEITPLLEAPRDKRIAALKLIPALVAKLNAEAKRAAKVMDEALEQAKALDASLSDIPF